jgi:hypothetical protein
VRNSGILVCIAVYYAGDEEVVMAGLVIGGATGVLVLMVAFAGYIGAGLGDPDRR